MIGLILKNMRLKADLSQKELGEKINLADNTISSYERGNSRPDFDTILSIAKVCGYELVFKDKENNIILLDDLNKEMDF